MFHRIYLANDLLSKCKTLIIQTAVNDPVRSLCFSKK